MISALALALSTPGIAEAAQHTFPLAGGPRVNPSRSRRKKEPHELTDADRENLAAAQAKRERRALKNGGPSGR